MPRYASTLLVTLFASLTLFAGFNALIDPFGITGAPDIPGLTGRDTRLLEDGGRVHVADRLARGGDHAILLGSSRTVDGFPHEPENWPGGLYNAGMRGTNIFELSQAAALAAESPALRCVVIGLDLDEFGTHSKAKATYWLSALTDGNRLFSLARVALSPNTFGASVQLIADNLTGGEPRVPWADTYPEGAQLERYEGGTRGMYRWYLGYDFDPERLALFETVLDRLTANGIQVTGFIHPLHAWREEAMWRAGRGEDYLAFRVELATLFERYADRQPASTCVPGGSAVLWDFSGFQPFASLPAPAPDQSDAHPAFYEPSHYLPHIGSAMLERMQDRRENDPFGHAVFGFELTPGNAGDSARALQERRTAWLATEDGAIATRLLDAVIAGDPAPEVSPPQFLNRDERTSLSDKLDAIAPAAARR
ncbi:hypothetical protein [Maricaulis parjimensis]|uniref:hypothetical protein n=1 Tax=Maricaulis parjimensis TaxID=144023 RepID=UPI00193A498D|nr:hypothetical protein [Maricaulis parjimensis]